MAAEKERLVALTNVSNDVSARVDSQRARLTTLIRKMEERRQKEANNREQETIVVQQEVLMNEQVRAPQAKVAEISQASSAQRRFRSVVQRRSDAIPTVPRAKPDHKFTDENVEVTRIFGNPTSLPLIQLSKLLWMQRFRSSWPER